MSYDKHFSIYFLDKLIPIILLAKQMNGLVLKNNYVWEVDFAIF